MKFTAPGLFDTRVWKCMFSLCKQDTSNIPLPIQRCQSEMERNKDMDGVEKHWGTKPKSQEKSWHWQGNILWQFFLNGMDRQRRERIQCYGGKKAEWGHNAVHLLYIYIVFYRKKTVIQIWKNMKVNKLWNYPFE